MLIGFAALSLTALGSCTTLRKSASTAKDFKVVGYFTPGTAEPERLPLQYLTHINYSFAIPAPTGDTLLPLRQDETLKRLVAHAHRKQQTEVFISVGGWDIGDGGGEDGRFHRMAERPEGRHTFVKSVMHLVRKYTLDGVDLDWEYPDENHRSAEDYVLLVSELADSLHASGKKLTAAVVASGSKGYGTKKEALDKMDWVNLMAYDGDYGGDILKAHSPYSYAVQSINYWINERKLPASKALIGLPFYSKKGFGQFGPTYQQLIADGASAYDDYWKGAFYNGINTIEAKTRLARKMGLGGVMIWEIGLDTADDTSLLKAIDRAKR
ncbi:glycoside hydrolase [Arundinibacter roseus]|uniref:chitinase n=2 Tax=Arundinibacter roseus TaxID=2070510 RepID=A0A4R4KNV7_9BACT|nr:glycoside hydrolase [Arundinibacter roseus]